MLKKIKKLIKGLFKKIKKHVKGAFKKFKKHIWQILDWSKTGLSLGATVGTYAGNTLTGAIVGTISGTTIGLIIALVDDEDLNEAGGAARKLLAEFVGPMIGAVTSGK